MPRIPRSPEDKRLILNERIRLLSGFFNALSLGLIGFAVIRPATESVELVGLEAWTWGTAGVVIHALAHYVLRYLRQETS